MRTIAVVTGSRAEYGILRRLIIAIDQDPELELVLIVTGSHLSPHFGATVAAVREDGIPIAERLETLLSSDSRVGTAKSIGMGVMACAEAYERQQPDLVVVLGDRFEIFAAAQAAMVLGIPIAHIHGGEITEGAFDDGFRHAITKMAHLHFVAHPSFAQRVIQMGEQPASVFVTGAPGLDGLFHLQPLDDKALSGALGCPLGKINILVTYHPVTLGEEDPGQAAKEICLALDAFPQAHIFITGQNADPAGQVIGRVMQDFVDRQPGCRHRFRSLGSQRYLSLLRRADVVVGNSSSGLIEAPAAQTPTVNVGIRQKGRPRAETVLDCPPQASAIEVAVHRALSAEMRAVAARQPQPDGMISQRIKAKLKSIPLQGLLHKRFYHQNLE